MSLRHRPSWHPGSTTPPPRWDSQVARLTASRVASDRRQRATLVVLALAAVTVAAVAGVMREVYEYEHGDVPSFALGLGVAVVPALLVWALPQLAFVPRQRALDPPGKHSE